jgi:hypothetical protein
MKIIYEEKLIIEDGDNKVVLDRKAMEKLYEDLSTLLRKDEY